MRLKIILLVTAILLGVAVIFLSGAYIDEIRNSNRLTDNLYQTNKDIQNLSLKVDEFKNLMTSQDSVILKELKIKPKNVKEFVTNNYYYRYKDTNIITTKIVNDTTFKAVVSKDCVNLDIDVILSNNNPKLKINSLEVNDTIRNILHAEKEHWWKFWNKKLVLTTKVGCGEATTKRIEITK